MGNYKARALVSTARSYWRSFAPAWIFPLIFLYGGLASDQLGHPDLFFWLIAVPLFFWSFRLALTPCLRKEISYGHYVFWGMVTPFLILATAVYSRLVIVRLLG